MISLLRRLWNDRSGNALILTAAAMPMLIGAAGLATDTIQWTLWKRELQRAADSAAIAGVYTRIKTEDEDTIGDAVCEDIDRTINRANRTMADLLDDCPDPVLPADDGDLKDQVSITLEVQKELTFSSMFLTSTPIIRASATAASISSATEFCVVALETLSTGITITGSSDVDLNGCSLMSNSSHPSAAASNGNSGAGSGSGSGISANSLAAVGFVQHNTSWDVESYDPGSTAVPNPFATKAVPPSSECTEDLYPSGSGGSAVKFGDVSVNRTGAAVTTASGVTIPSAGSSGTDDATDIVCIHNGIQGSNYRGVNVASGVTLALGPATYVIDGGDLTMNSTGASITCTGCTIILTNYTSGGAIGNFNITGGTLQISAPTTETHAGLSTSTVSYNYQGIALMQDPAATEVISNVNNPPNMQNIIQGNNGTVIQGAVYIPGRGLEFTGGSSTASACLQIVAKRVKFTGASSMQVMSECAGTGMGAIVAGDTSRKVRLIS